ncbi:TatD family hydrolase [Cerasicoccus fimbriatus]|uniref:TatD family hydrolase n=1 Tax=Cerasicoccus fimbriatus TaxID=3014554 RepID=UPI0022B4E003|nr:TatD family hydrolase [Cerasicoccus sp. TK19100]
MNDAPLYDAHCHWHDPRLTPHREKIERDLAQLPLGKVVVNGTHPGDWPAVAALAESDPRVIPAFGLHPWQVNAAPPDWLAQLEDFLARFPRAVIGEAGLDRWIKDHDLPRQLDALHAQLALAERDNRAISLHCLQAWGPMLEALKNGPRPARGFHLHGYGGSPEMIREFADLGGYFSFSAYVMHERKAKHRESLRATPPDRLLLETDAPDMLPPEPWQTHSLPGKVPFSHAPNGEPPHHPANIAASYAAATSILNGDPATIRSQVAENFTRLFGES